MTTTAKHDDPIAFRARWLIPVEQPPIDGGIVTVAGGRIVAVGRNDSGRPPRDLGDVALLPGLVNAHTHLEFSLLDRPLGQPGMSFPEWIGEVVGWRQSDRQGPGARSQRSEVRGQGTGILRGLNESHAAGVVALGEIATGDWPAFAPETNGEIEIVAFRELLGLSSEQIEPLLALGSDHIARFHGSQKDSFIKAGLSPHAPYTVHPQLLIRACALSTEHKIPLAMHLAESRDELELLRSHTGPLVELLKSLGAWRADVLPTGLRPLDYLTTLATAHHSLVIHGNYLARDEIEFLATHRDRLSLVYCPRTHAYFGHEPYPLARLLNARVRVAVGTDSRASNPDLRLLEELRYIARQHPTASPDAILRLGTLAGAEALGIADHCGSISLGKRAELAIVPLASDAGSPLESILFSSADAARWDGREISL